MRKLLRGLLVLGAIGFLAIAYRVTFVYEMRPGRCTGAREAAPAVAAAAEPAASRRPIRIVSYNIEGHAALVRPHHLEEIAQVIRAQRPDVVALQEVHRGTWEARFRDQAAELGRLTGMTVTFGPSFRVLGGEFGNAILAHSPLRDVELVPLPSFGEPRSLLRATVDVDGTDFEIMATHLAAWGGLNRRIRTRQAYCLAEHARAAGRRFVLCGDFNAAPASAELAALLDGKLMSLCGLASEPTHPLLDQRIDYILAGPGWEIGSTAVVHAGPSDHWPITAELRPVSSLRRGGELRAAR
ncbi:MAG TPA: endonuclease/exonuclease/phosphatase family protein [Thermoanaerobaculia bacterium]|nr:endonuclease/exonuclease/phosphatase family protein [Thermoanaerobaculia bacterium]